MGNLSTFLQNTFVQSCPRGWTCRKEARLLDEELDAFLGYSSFADVLLEHESGRRIWVEFEVSRADPVANHAKFATAHLFSPQGEADCFVSMVSAHVVRGRRNLASSTTLLLRQMGMRAFQTVLLPQLSGEDIKSLNHLPLGTLATKNLPVTAEIERTLTISQPIAHRKERRIHLAADLLEVRLSVRCWNLEMLTGEGAALWGKRRVRYFVFDPRTGDFAPSKFCAFVAINETVTPTFSIDAVGMNMALYASLDTPSESLFDGNKAQRHLSERLGMSKVDYGGSSRLDASFDLWLEKHSEAIAVDGKGVVFLLPPAWFD